MKNTTFNKKELCERLKTIRLETGLSQEEFAEKFYMDKRAYGKNERADTTPSLDLLCSIAFNYKKTLDYLVRGIEPNVLEELSTLMNCCSPTLQTHILNYTKFMLKEQEHAVNA